MGRKGWKGRTGGNQKGRVFPSCPSCLSCLSALAVASLVVATASAARPGAIRGRVELRRAAPPIERRPGVSELGAVAGRDISDRLRSVVYLETAPRGAF